MVQNRQPLVSSNKGWAAPILLSACLMSQPFRAAGTETVPRKPFAEWADVPARKELTVRFWYMEGEAYHVWYGRDRQNITVHKRGEDYGIDPMYGIICMEYGLTERWAADLNVGYGTVGTRSYSSAGDSASTTGVLDSNFGVRYQLFHEVEGDWLPTLSLRAGAILPGSYNKFFPFAPGNSSAAIEPSVYLRKHFGWTGFGGYGEAGYRWMRTSGDDQYAVALGFFQEIRSWMLNAGWRHFQQISGYDLQAVPIGTPLNYSPQVREVADALEAGFSYTTTKRNFKWGFYTSKTVDGSNTDSRFMVSGYLEIPFHWK